MSTKHIEIKGTFDETDYDNISEASQGILEEAGDKYPKNAVEEFKVWFNEEENHFNYRLSMEVFE